MLINYLNNNIGKALVPKISVTLILTDSGSSENKQIKFFTLTFGKASFDLALFLFSTIP